MFALLKIHSLLTTICLFLLMSPCWITSALWYGSVFFVWNFRSILLSVIFRHKILREWLILLNILFLLLSGIFAASILCHALIEFLDVPLKLLAMPAYCLINQFLVVLLIYSLIVLRVKIHLADCSINSIVTICWKISSIILIPNWNLVLLIVFSMRVLLHIIHLCYFYVWIKASLVRLNILSSCILNSILISLTLRKLWLLILWSSDLYQARLFNSFWDYSITVFNSTLNRYFRVIQLIELWMIFFDHRRRTIGGVVYHKRRPHHFGLKRLIWLCINTLAGIRL